MTGLIGQRLVSDETRAHLKPAAKFFNYVMSWLSFTACSGSRTGNRQLRPSSHRVFLPAGYAHIPQ